MKKRMTAFVMVLSFMLSLMVPMAAYGAEINDINGYVGKITAGSDQHSQAIINDDELYAWGINKYGQLGDGTTVDKNIPIKTMDNAVFVSAGNGHELTIVAGGQLYSSGYNASGQLGDGTNKNKSTPTRIMDNIIFASAGSAHSLAITKANELYAWGSNHNGQLGDGTTTNENTPTKIMDNIVFASAGRDHSLAITADGKLYAWGYNNYGQLGDGTTVDKNKPTKIMDDIFFSCATYYHSLAVTKSGELYAWGRNNYGQLGDGTLVDKKIPTKIMDNVVFASAGTLHSLAITADGKLYAWGSNTNGQLGDGTLVAKKTPTKIMDNVVFATAGMYHSLAITVDGKLYAWGLNNYGQVGDGTNINKNIPTLVLLPGYATTITLNKSGTTIKAGSTEKLTAELTPTATTDKDITWKSSDTSIATVDKDGLITALSPGTATVTAATGSGLQASCIVTVTDEDITGPTEPTQNILSVLLEEGEQIQLSITDNPADNATLKWSSANAEIAAVDSNGKVTALKPGQTQIWAESSDGTFKEYINVIILNKGEAVNARLAVNIKIGDSARLYLNPDTENIRWTSLDPSVVTVSDTGTITGVSKGLAIVTAEYNGEVFSIYVRGNS